MEYLPLPSALNFSPLIRYESHLIFHTPWSYTTSPVRFRLCDSHASSWILVCLYSTVLGTGSRDSRCFTPFIGDPAVFFETATTRGWSCVQWWWYCVGVPAGRHVHTWARARKRTSARLELLYCLSGPGRRGKARAIEREEEAHTHKSSSRKTSTKFRRPVYYFFRETTQNSHFKILLKNQNI